MIYKSYLAEQNTRIIKENLILFYGENLGLINHFKNQIKLENKNCEFLLFNQDEVLKNQNLIFNEINNESLFGGKKIILINDVNDKILNLTEDLEKNEKQQIYFFSNVLEKKSKIRSYFEKSKKCGIVACYADTEISLKKIILSQLKGFKGISTYNLNLILNNCKLDRVKLKNELEKIKTLFHNKEIEKEKLEKLLNENINNDFNILRDEALLGNKYKTNSLLSETEFEIEKNVYYLSLVNQRLNRLKEVNIKNKNVKLTEAINNLKPPVFWKDKPVFEKQAKIWTSEKIHKILRSTHKIEIDLKSNNVVSKTLLIKKLMIDICEDATA